MLRVKSLTHVIRAYYAYDTCKWSTNAQAGVYRTNHIEQPQWNGQLLITICDALTNLIDILIQYTIPSSVKKDNILENVLFCYHIYVRRRKADVIY